MDTPQGDQARFERVREVMGAESVRERDGRGIELPLALAALPRYEHCPARRHSGEEGFQSEGPCDDPRCGLAAFKN
jgi:hypothetical protein